MDIVTGIYWVVGKNILFDKHIFFIDEIKNKGYIDYPSSHFEKWDVLGSAYPCFDFATYPRGRLLYNLENKTYILYVDKCILPGTIEQIIDIFGIRQELHIIAYDSHYRCDGCMPLESFE